LKPESNRDFFASIKSQTLKYHHYDVPFSFHVKIVDILTWILTFPWTWALTWHHTPLFLVAFIK